MNEKEGQAKILVVGGCGFYGRYLVADLLRKTKSTIVVASRNPRPAFVETGRVTTARCDMSDLATLKRLAIECDLILHCAGPFQHLPLNPLRAAIAARCHYIDLAEDRLFARRVREFVPEIDAADITVLNGLSVCPAMEALFAELFRPYFTTLTSVRTFAAPDTRQHRGPAMFYTMLWGVGRAFEQPRNGQLARVHGWTEPEWIEFPPPVGKRLTFLVLEMADLDVLPREFGVGTVEFKAGTEHAWLNRLLNLAALIRSRTAYPDWEQFTPLVRMMSWLAGRIGKDEGGVIFEIGGQRRNEAVKCRIALMADKDGGFIPAVLAAMAAEELLSGRLITLGLCPPHKWISGERLLEGLTDRGLTLWWKNPLDETGWRPFTMKDLHQWI